MEPVRIAYLEKLWRYHAYRCKFAIQRCAELQASLERVRLHNQTYCDVLLAAVRDPSILERHVKPALMTQLRTTCASLDDVNAQLLTQIVARMEEDEGGEEGEGEEEEMKKD